jgi:hypothetical protein
VPRIPKNPPTERRITPVQTTLMLNAALPDKTAAGPAEPIADAMAVAKTTVATASRRYPMEPTKSGPL